MKKLMKS